MKKLDLKQNGRDLNRVSKRIYDAVKAIIELPETQQMYLWNLIFHEHRYNQTTNPKFAKHFIGLAIDEKYRKKQDKENDGEMDEHLLHPLLRADFISGYKDMVNGNGGGRWRKLLNTITTRYENGEYK